MHVDPAWHLTGGKLQTCVTIGNGARYGVGTEGKGPRHVPNTSTGQALSLPHLLANGFYRPRG